MKAKSAKSRSNNEPRRCQRRTLNGQCRMPAVDSSGTLCFDHARALDDHTDHSAVLTRFSRGFQTVEGINFALGDLYVLLAQGRISPRRAAVLTYMASLMLRTLPLMQKNPGKFVYRRIGATLPPSEADYFIVGEEDQPTPPSQPEAHDSVAAEVVETDAAHEEAEAGAARDNDAPENIPDRDAVKTNELHKQVVPDEAPDEDEANEKVQASKNAVPPGHPPLPATRQAFLNAVDQAIANADQSAVPSTDALTDAPTDHDPPTD